MFCIFLHEHLAIYKMFAQQVHNTPILMLSYTLPQQTADIYIYIWVRVTERIQLKSCKFEVKLEI